jgi:hypothetical protein
VKICATSEELPVILSLSPPITTYLPAFEKTNMLLCDFKEVAINKSGIKSSCIEYQTL